MNTHHPIFYFRPPRFYRWSESLERRGEYRFVRRLLARWVRERILHDWEWTIAKSEGIDSPHLVFIAPRVPTSLKIRIQPTPPDRFVQVSSWNGTEWIAEDIERDWNMTKDGFVFSVTFNRLALTKKLKIEMHPEPGSSIQVLPGVMKTAYSDAVYLVAGNRALATQEAWDNYKKCLEIEPHHYIASHRIAELATESKQWPEAIRYAMHANAYSWGNHGENLLWNACEKNRADLDTLIPQLRDEASAWEVSGHFGSTCLLYEKTYAFGFGRFHLLAARQIVDVRRSAAARMLRHLHFDYTTGKEKIAYAGLRVWRGKGNVIDVPTDHVAVVDHEDDNPAIQIEGRKRALYHLPELHRGDCIELVYFLIGIHPERSTDEPGFFLLSDLSSSFPTWKSRASLIAPEPWNVRCMTTNGGPSPSRESIDDGRQRYHVEVDRVFYDGWGVSDMERRYRSPHFCAAWGDRAWSEIASEGATKFCHVIREDTLPEPIQQAIEPVESVEGKLRVGFDWIRDNLKYMSLQSNKDLTDDPDLARKIVAIGVGDCMDRAYLVSILCRTLGIPCEYVVTAADAEYVVPEVPAQQFDHILVRAHLDSRDIYLDATRTDTPFGWTPRYLQGLQVLPLTTDATLETVAEETPEANQIAISEQLHCDPVDGVAGTFEMTALGMPARWWDSHWKAISMDVENPIRVARLALRRQLPSAEVTEWDVKPYESGYEHFGLRGRHARTSLFPINGQFVGMADYKTELFQMYQLKDRDWRGVNIFPLPLRYWISLAITCPEGYSIAGTSAPTRFSSTFGDVLVAMTQNDGSLAVECTMTVKRKFVTIDDPTEVLQFLNAWERALTFAFILTPRVS